MTFYDIRMIKIYKREKEIEKGVGRKKKRERANIIFIFICMYFIDVYCLFYDNLIQDGLSEIIFNARKIYYSFKCVILILIIEILESII